MPASVFSSRALLQSVLNLFLFVVFIDFPLFFVVRIFLPFIAFHPFSYLFKIIPFSLFAVHPFWPWLRPWLHEDGRVALQSRRRRQEFLRHLFSGHNRSAGFQHHVRTVRFSDDDVFLQVSKDVEIVVSSCRQSLANCSSSLLYFSLVLMRVPGCVFLSFP